MSEKSIVVFTNFWDADAIIKFRFMLLHDAKTQKLYRVHLLKTTDASQDNFSVHSIALSHPNLSKCENMGGMNRLDFLCPTYDMLDRYKKDQNWDAYTRDYTNLIKKRKDAIKEWANSLKPDHVYFLCCWENTAKGAHCHREILHKAFSQSKTISQKIVSVYRHGDKYVKKERNNLGFAEAIQSTLSNAFMGASYDSFDANMNRFIVTEDGRTGRTSALGNVVFDYITTNPNYSVSSITFPSTPRRNSSNSLDALNRIYEDDDEEDEGV